MDIPWVEKYRPSNFDDIVLGADNRTMFETMLRTGYIPHMLFFGAPGTGKTTTIINLINTYQDARGERNKGLMIHLNASDERGIDVIRSQIQTFVSSKTFFGGGMKFVVLDEIDYMTKCAQQALGCMLQEHSVNARFCIICNYISKIDATLQSGFVKLQFSALPRDAIVEFLHRIAAAEGVPLTADQADHVQQLFGSDVRSMINYLQTNQDGAIRVLHTGVWDTMLDQLGADENINVLQRHVWDVSCAYGIDRGTLMKELLVYGLKTQRIHFEALHDLATAIHTPHADLDHLVPHILLCLLKRNPK